MSQMVTGTVLIARLVLAAIFALAGVTKLADRAGSLKSMVDFGVPKSLARPVALLLPLAEIACAAALIPSTSAWWGAIGVMTMLLLFMGAISVSLARGRRPDCHCFGQLHSAPVGWNTLGRNVVLAVVAGFVLWLGPGEPTAMAWSGTLSRADVIFLLLAVASMVIAASALGIAAVLLRQNGRFLLRLEAIETALGIIPGASQADEGLPVNSPAPGFRLPGLEGPSTTLDILEEAGKPVLLVFSEPGCGACDALLPEIAAWQRDLADHFQTVVISRGTVDENRAARSKYEIRNVLLQTDREVAELYHVVGTPSAVMVNNERVASTLAIGPDAIRRLVASASRPLTRRRDYLPHLQLSDLDGDVVDLATLKGRRTVLLFWNPACGFCRGMLEDLKAWEANRPQDSPALFLVASGSADANRHQAFRSRVLLDRNRRAQRTFGASGTPSAVLIDEEGRVASDIALGAQAVLHILLTGT